MRRRRPVAWLYTGAAEDHFRHPLRLYGAILTDIAGNNTFHEWYPNYSDNGLELLHVWVPIGATVMAIFPRPIDLPFGLSAGAVLTADYRTTFFRPLPSGP
jgi:hypothetical protein